MPHATSPPGSSPPAQTTTQDTTMMDAADEPESTQTPKASLDDMFDDDSASDDEFSSSAVQKEEESTASIPQGIRASDPETLVMFYSRLFPFRSLFQWLNASPTPTPRFTNREFAFVLPSDAYIRYQSFPTADALRKQCLQMTPVRFEIGPEYTFNPRDRKTVRKASAFRPISKELVFDIDMTDYDDIRTCCQKANICPKCWEFMTMAIKVLNRALREDFGFKHLLFVYSGRRGVHCWVGDRRARTLDDAQRKSIAGYLELLRGGGQGQKRVNLRRPLHPSVDRSLALLNPHFASVLAAQEPFANPEGTQRLLSLLPDPTLTAALSRKWDSSPSRTSMQKWSDIDALASSGNLSIPPKQLLELKQDIRLEYTYPRLDAEVSKKLNHLLKSPFVIHPGTGRVCVPIDPAKADEFDPFAVPTVGQLLGEIDAWKGEEQGKDEDGRIQDWKKTSLRPYVEHFKRFVDGLLKDEGVERKRTREEGAEGMEF